MSGLLYNNVWVIHVAEYSSNLFIFVATKYSIVLINVYQLILIIYLTLGHSDFMAIMSKAAMNIHVLEE